MRFIRQPLISDVRICRAYAFSDGDAHRNPSYLGTILMSEEQLRELGRIPQWHEYWRGGGYEKVIAEEVIRLSASRDLLKYGDSPQYSDQKAKRYQVHPEMRDVFYMYDRESQ